MSPTGRRLLFALNEPGYFRMYGTTIIEMTRRGWEVALLFEKPNRRGPDAQHPAGADDRVRSLGASPRGVSRAATILRLGLNYVRYLEPSFAGAGYLRQRAEKHLPPELGFLKRVTRLPRWAVSAAIALARMAERALPVSRETLECVRQARPDVIVVSPAIVMGDAGVRQAEIMKAGRALGVPVVMGVASWDHLTSKGVVSIVPDAVTVWNETQADEAETLQWIPRSRVVVTGAQSMDHWFEPAANDTLKTFRRSLGIEDQRRVLLVVGSSPNMAPGDSEVQFVRRWLSALRTAASPTLRDAFVIVRPHPGNTAPWQEADLGDPHTVVHQKTYTGFPLTDEEIETFRQSIQASAAVIGVNTTAMIEAAILRRPVFSVRDGAFEHSQRQTLHFAYISSDHEGFVVIADTLPDHIAQLEELFAHSLDTQAGDRFVARFVRPLGMNIPATVHLSDAIERVANQRSRAVSPSLPAPAATSQSAR